MGSMKRRADKYWQAWCTGKGCRQLLGTFLPSVQGEDAVCPKCGVVSRIELTGPGGYPICYAKGSMENAIQSWVKTGLQGNLW